MGCLVHLPEHHDEPRGWAKTYCILRQTPTLGSKQTPERGWATPPETFSKANRIHGAASKTPKAKLLQAAVLRILSRQWSRPGFAAGLRSSRARSGGELRRGEPDASAAGRLGDPSTEVPPKFRSSNRPPQMGSNGSRGSGVCRTSGSCQLRDESGAGQLGSC